MTILQKEINNRSVAINRIGYLAATGLVTITADNESVFQTGMAAMIEVNEQDRRRQEEAFNQMPWLRKLTEKEERGNVVQKSIQNVDKRKQVKKPCIRCVYYDACGCNTRTEPCEGRMTKRERKYEEYGK